MVNGKSTAKAITPDQLLPYVLAVSGMEYIDVDGLPLYVSDGAGVFAAHQQSGAAMSLEEAVDKALGAAKLKNITVLAAARPPQAPVDCQCRKDMYWAIDLPYAAKNAKLRNMLKRASREIGLEATSGDKAWTPDHARLAEAFCRRKKAALDDGSIYIFNNLDKYLSRAPDAILFSAKKKDGALAACAIGDFSAFSTAFYMFAFRQPDAPPGTADLLLDAIIAEAGKRGMARINLGLGIDSGVEFFKKKWGAAPWLPHVETSWDINRKGWFARIFG